jgi:hypothetical protein
MQQQNYSLEALAKRDAGPDPFGTAKAAAPPPSPAPKPQADGEEEPDDADEKALAADVALIKSGQADLLKRIEELPAPIDADAVREAVAAQLAQSEAKEAERAQATAIAIAEQVKEALAKAMKREEEPEPADVGIFFDALADQLNAEAANG